MLKQVHTEIENKKQQFEQKCEGFADALLDNIIVDEVYSVAFSAVSETLDQQNQVFASKFLESTVSGMTQQIVLSSVVPETIYKSTLNNLLESMTIGVVKE